MIILPFVFIVPTLVYGSYCPWPLEDTTHQWVSIYFPVAALNTTIPCALGCGLEPAVSILFTPAEQDTLDQITLALCYCALGVTLVYSINLVLQHQDHPRKFLSADLAYQIPFLINIGYLIIIVAVLFHPGSAAMDTDKPAYCNKDEKTLSRGDPVNGNERCTVLAVAIFLAIKIISSYTMVLSVVLFLTFWKPWYRNKKCKYIVHGFIFLTITVQTACVLGLSSVQGNSHMKLCLPTINSPTVTLWLEIIPNTIYQGIATILLCSCLWKLYKMTTKKVSPRLPEEHEMSVVGKDFSEFTSQSTRSLKSFRRMLTIPRMRTRRHSDNAEQLRSLTYRLLAFNITQSTFVAILTFVFIYWYQYKHSWENAATQVVQCQVQTYGIPALMGVDVSDGSLLEAAYNCVHIVGKGPPLWSHWLMYVCFPGSALGGLMLTCSTHNIKKYRTAGDWVQSKVTRSTTDRPFSSAMTFTADMEGSRNFENEEQFGGFGTTSPVLLHSKATAEEFPRPSSKRNSKNWFCEVGSTDKGEVVREILRFSIVDEAPDLPITSSKEQAESLSSSNSVEMEVPLTSRRVSVEPRDRLVDNKSFDKQGYGSVRDKLVEF